MSVDVSRGRSTADDWREYELLHTLHRFYLELAVKVAGGYFLIVGGVLTLVLANSRGEPIVIAALVVPLAMSVALVVVSVRVRDRIAELRTRVQELGRTLGVEVAPHVEILEWAISGAAILLSLACLFLAGLGGWWVFAAIRQ